MCEFVICCLPFTQSFCVNLTNDNGSNTMCEIVCAHPFVRDKGTQLIHQISLQIQFKIPF